MNTKTIVVFGESPLARSLKRRNEANGHTVFLVDNDTNKWGREIKGHIVYSPSEILSRSFDKVYIAIRLFSEAISKQLINDFRIPEDKIVSFWGDSPADRADVGLRKQWIEGYCIKETIDDAPNTFTIENISLEGNRISYKYCVEGPWKEFFRNDDNWSVPDEFAFHPQAYILSSFEPTFFEYTIDIAHVPKSIAVIPLLSNFMPLVWMNDATVYLDELDEDFYYSLDEILVGFMAHKKEWFLGNKKGSRYVKVGELVKNHNNAENAKSLLLFSGGVDAWDALADLAHLKPTLISILGGDIYHENSIGFEGMYDKTRYASSTLGLESTFVKSNYRNMLHSEAIDIAAMVKGHNWDGFNNYWNYLQHALSMLGSVAPYAFAEKCNLVFIASSDPLGVNTFKLGACSPFDENMKFGSSIIIHKSFHKLRVDKLRNIGTWSKRNNISIKLRVCFAKPDGSNCCICEKCIRTWLGLLSVGYNPFDFGFQLDRIEYPEKMAIEHVRDKFANKFIVPKANSFWYGVIDNFDRNFDIIETHSEELGSFMPIIREIVSSLMEHKEPVLKWFRA